MTRLSLGATIVLTTLGTLAISNTAHATLTFTGSGGRLLRRIYTLNPNDSIYVQTTGCGSTYDTVLFLLQGTETNRTTRGFNDDNGASGDWWCSTLAYTNLTGSPQAYEVIATTYPGTPAAPITYKVWFSTTGWLPDENVTLDGLAQHIWSLEGTNRFDTVGLRPSVGGGYVDTVLYVIDPRVGAASVFDDDSSLWLLSRMTSNISTANGVLWVVAGTYLYNNTVGTNFDIWISGTSESDNDGDGLPSAIESSKGTLDSKADFDSDGISDYQELVGVPAASLDGLDSSIVMPWADISNPDSNLQGADPTVQDLFIQIDWMTAPDHDHNPLTSGNWTTIQSDLASMFSYDSVWNGRSIRVHPILNRAVSETTMLGFETCTGTSNYTSFYSIKSNPWFFNPLQATTHHYAIFGHDVAIGCSDATNSGRAELWGSDLIVGLGHYVNSPDQQHGSFTHELGHTLALNHNGNNDNINWANSCVHSSPMNYRYALGGWGDGTISSVRKFSYSRGACDSAGHNCSNTCTNKCVPSSQTSPKSSCSSNNGSCDCDKSEWTQVNTAFPYEADELTTWHYCQINPSDCDGPGGPGTARTRAFRPYFLGDLSQYNGLHRELGHRRRDRLVRSGLREGVDFVFDSDLGRSYSIE